MNKYDLIAFETLGKITAILKMAHLTDGEKIKRISDKITEFDMVLKEGIKEE